MTVATLAPDRTWIPACPSNRLAAERGVAVLLPDGRQAALFRTFYGELYAVDNIDPFSGAAVLSRGIVGDRAGEPTVASPMLKQVFALRTGACLDDPEVRLDTHPVRERGGVVEIAAAPDARTRT
ncbi:nitrite reductase small subunit NirD [Marinitenerispora sediminis]|uniref:Nitrite reductase (NAD(P)H) small subunit n=1 Tax=Marinitenerispora sediminis TaxID=1931232 RepID=A0A368T2B5_9ACTN|nr:nitrite reductase small subunit NirD [Marinitenerispora sediminis]RCV54847.1 nitrite reductase (NAD(P)H) small subunit [Marinitenerispora sediminis]RCV55078.1 nitrite reductase (NAD(P)H) small subunit [Marinitenerispora sediminis]RCV56250.1 nitrite reductase (NAD(P)H) small subunit [Marinitenerispora sediminis]